METEKTVANPEFTFDKSINDDERQEILSEIEKAVSASKSPLGDSKLKLNPEKKGMAFPMVINIILFLAVGASFFFSNMLFEQRQGEISQETQFYLSAEGKLLEELRRESQQALEEKDSQISQIQTELEDLDRRSNELSANMEATITAKEAELRSEMEAALEAERMRLSGTGTSQEDIQTKLDELENELLSVNNQALLSFRDESERVLEEQRLELEKTIALNQSMLEDANAEKRRLEEESREREAEMASQFEEEKAALEASTEQARTALSNLANLQEQQYLLDDQVVGAYRSIIERINLEEWETALEGVGSLRRLLTSENVQSIPAYAKKQTTDLFILDIIKEKIETTANRAGASTASLVNAAELLLAAEELAERGLAAYQEGDSEGAADYLNRSIDKLPLIQQSYQTLNLMETDSRTRLMEAALADGREFASIGNITAAVESFSRAVRQGAPENKDITDASISSLVNLYDARQNTLISERTSAIEELEDTQSRALTRVERENNQRLIALRQEKNDEIAALQQKIAEQETALALQKLQLIETETTMMEALALSEQDMEKLNEQQAANRTVLEEGYQETLAELEALYSSELETLKENQTLALEEQIAGSRLVIEELENEIVLKQELLLEWEEKYSAILTESDSTNETLLAEWEEKYTLLQSELSGSKEALAEAVAEVETLNQKLYTFEELGYDYTSLKSRIDRLMNTGNPEDFYQAENLLVGFLDTEYSELLPGLSSVFEKVKGAYASEEGRTAGDAGAELGRIRAIEDILLFTGYLSKADRGGQESLLEEIEARASSDSQYASAIREIEALAIAGSEIAGISGTISGLPRLLGTVARVSGNNITIEVLADLPVETDMEVSIRRKTRRSDEIILASGVITSSGRNQVEAEVSGSLGAGRVEISDLVYIIIK